jgi:hypothetical protein
MQRIDGTTAAAVLPAPKATGTPGYFTDGNPATGVQPTTMDNDWANMVQEELIAPILAAGIALDKSNHSQLLAALHTLFGGATGSNANGTWINLPGGFILQIGSVAIAPTGGGTTGGVVNGVGTFPEPFPNGAIGLFGNGTDMPSATFHPFVITFPRAGLSKTQFAYTADTTQSGTVNFTQATSFYWIAIGR